MKQSELFKKFKSTYADSIFHLLQHTLLFVYLIHLLVFLTTKYNSYFVKVGFIPILTLMNVKTFTIFHDCGHNSYSPNQWLNFIIGSLFGIWIMTPVSWSYDHSLHHLTNGNIENTYNYDFNVSVKYTKQQFDTFSKVEKMAYCVFRNPFVFFGIFAPFKTIFLNRFDYPPYKDAFNRKILNILNFVINNVGIVFMIKYINDIGIGREYFVALYFSSILISMITHNQHTFNPSYVVGNNAWTLKESSIMGSSFIVIPPYLNFVKFFTNGFEYHHIHHLNPRIPGYNLEKYHDYVVEDNILDVSNICKDAIRGISPQSCEFIPFTDATNRHEVKSPCKLTFEDCFYNCWLFLYDTERGIYIQN